MSIDRARRLARAGTWTAAALASWFAAATFVSSTSSYAWDFATVEAWGFLAVVMALGAVAGLLTQLVLGVGACALDQAYEDGHAQGYALARAELTAPRSAAPVGDQLGGIGDWRG